MLILLDLDGTLTNTVHPSWKPFRDGEMDISSHVNEVPLFPYVQEFIHNRREKGDELLVVSDSHFRYVRPICEMLDLKWIALAGKPNTNVFRAFLEKNAKYKDLYESGECIYIGDAKLDIEFGRCLHIPTIWIHQYRIDKILLDSDPGIGNEFECVKMGPTYCTTWFRGVESILENLTDNLYSLERELNELRSYKSLVFWTREYSDKSIAEIHSLARQEQGECDRYSRADAYYKISNESRSLAFLCSLADGISNFINQESILKREWDYLTYVTDKEFTIPRNKMQEIFDLVQTSIPKERLFEWSKEVSSSIRKQVDFDERQDFLKQNLHFSDFNDPEKFKGKNIIVIDDQLTTGATAWQIIHSLKEKGANNILFIALFQMIDTVSSHKICPKCGKKMLLKIRRKDGKRFYSCLSPEYGGDGCGYSENIP